MLASFCSLFILSQRSVFPFFQSPSTLSLDTFSPPPRQRTHFLHIFALPASHSQSPSPLIRLFWCHCWTGAVPRKLFDKFCFVLLVLYNFVCLSLLLSAALCADFICPLSKPLFLCSPDSLRISVYQYRLYFFLSTQPFPAPPTGSSSSYPEIPPLHPLPLILRSQHLCISYCSLYRKCPFWIFMSVCFISPCLSLLSVK